MQDEIKALKERIAELEEKDEQTTIAISALKYMLTSKGVATLEEIEDIQQRLREIELYPKYLQSEGTD